MDFSDIFGIIDNLLQKLTEMKKNYVTQDLENCSITLQSLKSKIFSLRDLENLNVKYILSIFDEIKHNADLLVKEFEVVNTEEDLESSELIPFTLAKLITIDEILICAAKMPLDDLFCLELTDSR